MALDLTNVSPYLSDNVTANPNYVEGFAPPDSLIDLNDQPVLTWLTSGGMDPAAIEWDVATFRGEEFRLDRIIVAQRVTGYQAAIRKTRELIKEGQHVAYWPVVPGLTD